MKPKNILLGVDGCRGGWLGIMALEPNLSRLEAFLYPRFDDFLKLPAQIIAVDIPIGLLEEYRPGGRVCDQMARKLLGKRAPCVFTPPPRRALKASSYPEAKRLCQGHLTRQAWNLAAKIKEVDELLSPALQERVFETHPELVFWSLNQKKPLPPKKTPEGQRKRLFLLLEAGLEKISDLLKLFPGHEVDLLDAGAALWAAKKLATGKAERLPAQPPRDRKGLRMEIWF